MNRPKAFCLNLVWNSAEFFLIIPEQAIKQYYPINNETGDSNTDQIALVYYHNLARQIFARLSKIFPRLKMVASQLGSPEHRYNQSIMLELGDNPPIELILAANLEQLEPILSHFLSATLKLGSRETGSYALNLTLDQQTYCLGYAGEIFVPEDNSQTYVKLVLLINGKPQPLFVPKTVFYHLYESSFVRAIPFQFNKYFIELIINLINTRLCRIKSATISISCFTIAKLELNRYYRLSISEGQFSSYLLLPNHHSQLLGLLESYCCSDIEEQPTLVSKDMKLTLPITSYHINLTSTQMKQLKTGDILLGLQKIDSGATLDPDIVSINMGRKSIIAAATESGSLIIKGVENIHI